MKKHLLVVFFLLLIVCAFSFADQRYYEGNTGNNIKLAIPEPTGTNIAQDKQWLLTLIQTQLTDTFTKYSPVVVIDRQNEKMAEAEIQLSENGSYSEDGYAEFGKFVNANHIIAAKLINAGSNYSLSIRINEVETNQTKWSFSSICFPAEISDGSIINKAVYDLLTQIGIKLTAEGKVAINGSVDANTQNMQENLSKGINAQKRGATSIEAMEYYYAAADYSPNSSEINSRINSLGSAVSSGNLSAKMKNEAELYEYWKKTIKEANDYFMKNPPYEIIYSTELKSTLKPVNGVAFFDIEFSIGSEFKSSSQKTIESIREGLKSSNQLDLFNNWPYNDWAYSSRKVYLNDTFLLAYNITIALVNQMDEIILSKDVYLPFGNNGPMYKETFEKVDPEKFTSNEANNQLKLKITSIKLCTNKNNDKGTPIDISKVKITTLEEKKELENLEKLALLKQQEEKEIQKQKEREEKEKERLEDERFAQMKEAEKQRAIEREEAEEIQRERNTRDGLTMSYSPTFVGDNYVTVIDFCFFLHITEFTFGEISLGVGGGSDTIKDESAEDEFAYINVFLDFGLNIPIGDKFQPYALIGVGALTSIEQGSGVSFRAGLGIDIGQYLPITIEYSLDYVIGGGFADRCSIGFSMIF